MKTKRKFFDADGKEVPAKRAVKAVELTFDKDRLVSSVIYEVAKESTAVTVKMPAN